MDSARQCHNEMRKKTERVITLMKLDDYEGRTGRLTAVVESVEKKLGKTLKRRFSRRLPVLGGSMAYYKVRIEIWCDFDPQGTSLDEIVEHTHIGEAVCIRQEVVSVVDRPQDIEDGDAMSFFGGEEGDADQSQG